MKFAQRELIIIPLNQDESGNKITAKIIEDEKQVGIFQLSKKIFPALSDDFGAPFLTQYEYSLIFENNPLLNNFSLPFELPIPLPFENNDSLNVALNSIQTNGFYKLNGGVFVVNDLGLPLGNYKNIGTTPDGNEFNLEMTNEDSGAKIIITKRLC